MTEEDKLWVKDISTKELQRVLDKENADVTELEKTHTKPSSLKALNLMTDTELNEYLLALNESLARVLTVESGIKQDILKVDKEKMSR